jgi:uncharacterized protein YciI
MRSVVLSVILCLLSAVSDAAQPDASAPSAASPAFDEALARSVGADESGMRRFVFVLLKTGPTRVPNGPERDEMFEGHFANIDRLSTAGKLVLAGPFDGVDGWRGMFVFATDVEEAKQLVATDPVVRKGEMVAEFHEYFGSAALMLINGLHRKIDRP